MVSRSETLLRRLTRDQRGTSVIELALAGPLLAMMVLGVTDASLVVAKKLKMQQAATRSIEMATTGGLNSAAFQYLAQDAATAAGVGVQNAVLDKWLECDGVRQDSFSDSCTGTAQVGRFVSISITDQFAPLFISSFGGTVTGKASVRVQ